MFCDTDIEFIIRGRRMARKIPPRRKRTKMPRTFKCPACAAPLNFTGAEKMQCGYCGSNIIVPGKAFVSETVQDFVSGGTGSAEDAAAPQPSAHMPMRTNPRTVQRRVVLDKRRRGIVTIVIIIGAFIFISGLVPTLLAIVFGIIAAIAGALSSM